MLPKQRRLTSNMVRKHGLRGNVSRWKNLDRELSLVTLLLRAPAIPTRSPGHVNRDDDEPCRAIPRYLSDLFRNGTPAALSNVPSCSIGSQRARRTRRDGRAGFRHSCGSTRPDGVAHSIARRIGDRHEVEDAFQATFLVLAVRARSIRRRGSLAAWLHRVALRSRSRRRSPAAKRRRHELVRAAMIEYTTQNEGSDPVCDHERKVIIQEEIGRLPENAGRRSCSATSKV